jgi:hypothetical protein
LLKAKLFVVIKQASRCGRPTLSRSRPVRAGLGVDAFLGETKALDRATTDQVLFNDRGGVFGLDMPVPDGVRVDDDCRAVLALVKASGLVNAHPAAKPGSFSQLLQLRVEFALAIGGTRRTRRIGGALIQTDEDVMFKQRQAGFLLEVYASRLSCEAGTGLSRVDWIESAWSVIGPKFPQQSDGREGRSAKIEA